MTDPRSAEPNRADATDDPLRAQVSGTDIRSLQAALARSLDERDSLAAELAQLRAAVLNPSEAELAIAALSKRLAETEQELEDMKAAQDPRPGATDHPPIRRAGFIGRLRSLLNGRAS